ncbi:MAG: peptide chain release factor N(5)-glutamine methyltransferase [Burkholderiales bacterium]|nr:peptide chain release factor N(5)-glutamine methyltransferase [Burkholderiales bacterium]MDE2625616.1 peptide chain release factor N(5)-glutamine methyltransferase [Burkholderiales bacterium]
MTTDATTVADMLQRARSMGVERLDAQQLLAHVLARPRSWLAAHEDAEIDGALSAALAASLVRCAAGEPLAYVLGEQEFHGLVLRVNADVLVPRPDTEALVDWALELLAGALAPVVNPRVVDLGTGSGAIALAVRHAHPDASVLATDISAAALEVARANATRLGLPVSMLAGSWWGAAPRDRRFHLALSNPPYVAGDDPHLAALRHEPMLALTPGGDGLAALRQIVGGAAEHLEPGGWLLLEHGHDQAEAVRALLREHDFSAIETRRDLGGRLRCTGGRN